MRSDARAAGPKPPRILRVLVAEDSTTVRRLIVGALMSDPGLTVVGEAVNGREAVELAMKLRPDVITMDVRMPLLDGIEATREIMAQLPTPIVIVSDAAREDAVRLALDATAAGALTILPKPDGNELDHHDRQLVATVKAMADVHTVRRWAPRPVAIRHDPHSTIGVRLVAIAASTGGPAALRDLLAALPASFPVPIAVVQHIAAGFVGGLVSWLRSSVSVGVEVAVDRAPLRPGVVYVAPDDRHLGFDPTGNVRLSAAPAIGSFRPSATHLFDSAAQTFGAGVAAVVLTGMGNDGVAGLAAVHSAQGRVFAQDKSTSVIFGMANEAVRAGVVDEVLPLPALAARLIEWVT